MSFQTIEPTENKSKKGRQSNEKANPQAESVEASNDVWIAFFPGGIFDQSHYLPHTCSVVSLKVPKPDPNTPKPEGRQTIPVKGEPLGVVSNWPPALQAALARWGSTQGKSPALTALDITGKPLYTLTYGEKQDLIC